MSSMCSTAFCGAMSRVVRRITEPVATPDGLAANDIRELENMNPIPEEEGGDAYLINGNMMPITSAAPVGRGVDEENGQREDGA